MKISTQSFCVLAVLGVLGVVIVWYHVTYDDRKLYRTESHVRQLIYRVAMYSHDSGGFTPGRDGVERIVKEQGLGIQVVSWPSQPMLSDGLAKDGILGMLLSDDGTHWKVRHDFGVE
jgi:hypothetical protein